MHLSILGPTTPWPDGHGRGLGGDLTALDLKNRPEGWGIRLWAESPFGSTCGFDDETMPQGWGI